MHQFQKNYCTREVSNTNLFNLCAVLLKTNRSNDWNRIKYSFNESPLAHCSLARQPRSDSRQCHTITDLGLEVWVQKCIHWTGLQGKRFHVRDWKLRIVSHLSMEKISSSFLTSSLVTHLGRHISHVIKRIPFLCTGAIDCSHTS